MHPATPDSKGELALLRRLRGLLATPSTPTGPAPAVQFGDDMALIDPADPGLLWTVDMLMDGVDFRSATHPWHSIGHKAMAASLSDCAAMAVVPVAALAAVALENSLSMDDALALLAGAHDCGRRHGCPLVGGDTNSWDAPTVISLTVAARCPPGGRPVTRSGARPGDRIWITGRVGGSLLGRHMTFEPRLDIALQISRLLAPHALIDISDGLAVDLGHILEASACGAVLDERSLDAAIHPDAERLAEQDGRPPREHALHDGEDFELIAVLPPDAPRSACQQLNLLPLGRIEAEPGLFLESVTGTLTPIPLRGWEHFR